jgi:prepilin-type N-terminal cleavage/methylation domain-containing protein
MTTDRHTSATGPRGFTLIEATLAMVLLGMAAAGVLLPFVGGASVQADGMHRTLAAMLANDQIERIVSTPFAELAASTPYSSTEAKGQVKDANGTTVLTDPMYANFSRETTCQEVSVPPHEESEETAVNCKFILATVTVRYQEQPLATVRRLISQS